MASHMHLGTAVAPAHYSPPHIHPAGPNTAQFKTTPAYWEWKEHNWELSGDTDQSLGIGLTAADGLTNFIFIFLFFRICDNLLYVLIMKHVGE